MAQQRLRELEYNSYCSIRLQPAHMDMQAQSASAQVQALAFSRPSVASNFLPTPFLVMSMSAQREWRGTLLVSSRLMAWLLRVEA